MDLALLTQAYAEHLTELTQSYGQVLAECGYDAVVIHAGSPKLRSAFDDQYWPLRPTPHFQHWLPLSAPNSALVIAQGRRPKLVWMQAQSFWETTELPAYDFWQRGFEIVTLTDQAKLPAHLPTGRVAFIAEDAQCGLRWHFAEQTINPRALLQRLDGLRAHKTHYEALCLEEANRRAAQGHTALADAFRSSDASELELHLLYLGKTGQDDPDTPYKNIVALGANAATLHHVSYQRARPQSGDAQSLLVDAGASFLGYCSDITRTYVKGSGAAASVFGALVAGVEQLQQRLCADIQIGARYEALHDTAHRYVARTLREVGLVWASEEEAVSSGVTRAFFPHGLGHSLGLQCHDVGCAQVKPRGDNPFLRNTSVIAQRQCFTIEPGVYFIGALLEPLRQGIYADQVDWTMVDRLAALGGVRIEDDLLVVGGAETARNLTRAFLPVSAGA